MGAKGHEKQQGNGKDDLKEGKGASRCAGTAVVVCIIRICGGSCFRGGQNKTREAHIAGVKT